VNRGFSVIFAMIGALGLILSGCGSDAQKESSAPTEKQRVAPAGSSSASTTPAANLQDSRPVIVAFGDSLTAGVVQDTYPDYLQELLDADGYKYRVENQGVSGDTTTDGLARIDNVIAAHPALVLLEFGGNDGLRGIPVNATKDNLEQMITRLQAAKIPTVLLGITLPPNYGSDYIKPFTAMFPELAKKYKLRLFPFLLVNVYQHPDMMQPDGIHPNGEGNKIVARDVLKFIQPMLRTGSAH
jgi:acyl-CoA thioesterase I